MKASRALLIIQTTLMYISMILFYIPAFNILNSEDTLNNGYKATLITGLSLVIIAFLVAIATMILSTISIFLKNDKNNTKFIMIIKIILIPWYIANFTLWALMILGMLNPFLFVAIPIMIVLSMFGTYIYMLSSSLNNICLIISNFKNKTLEVKPLFIVGMILQLFFCIDIVGAILTFIASRQYKK